MKKILLSASVLTLLLSSCKKDNAQNDSKAVTKENIIGDYKLTGLTTETSGFKMDVLAQMEPCQRDDEYHFKAGDVYDYVDAGTQCDVNGDGTGSWTLSGDVMTLDGMDAKVTKLTATILEATITMTETVNNQQVTSSIHYSFARK